ncbi:MAG: ATP-binding protein [Byssovorax sp.]
MKSTHERILEIVCRHVGAGNAHTIVQSALQARRISAQTVTDRDVAALAPLIGRSVALSRGAQALERLLRELHDLSASVAVSAQRTVRINVERDISEGRAAARLLCESGGVRPLAMQKITTIVSELARNIVSYTPGGAVELVLKADKRLFAVTSTDEGKGIPNLEEILGGRYKSRTGLGAGILGVKRLSSRFEIQTGPTGTRILSEVPC